MITAECRRRYIGETSRNGFARGLEYRAALNNKYPNSTLYQHRKEEEHGDKKVAFRMKVTEVWRRHPQEAAH